MLEFKRRKTLEKHEGNSNVEKIMELMNEMRKEDSTCDVLNLINDLSHTFNLYNSLPPELLSKIFEYLSLEDILRKRSIFLVCMDWTKRINNYGPFWKSVLLRVCGKTVKPNTYSIEKIRSYCVMRYNIENSKKNSLAENIKKNENVTFMVSIDHQTLTGIEGSTRSTLNEKYLEYFIFMDGIEYMNVRVRASKKICTCYADVPSHFIDRAQKFRIMINYQEFCEFSFNELTKPRERISGYYNSNLVVDRKHLRMLEEMNFLKYIVDNNIISSPKEEDGSFRGSLRLVTDDVKQSPLLMKTLVYVFSFVQIFNELSSDNTIWSFSDENFDGGIEYIDNKNVFFQMKGFGHGLSYEEYKKFSEYSNKYKIFENDDLEI